MKVKIISVCLLCLIIFVGCNSIEPNSRSILGVNDVKKAFARKGIELIEEKNPNMNELMINKVKPTLFKIDQYFDDRLFIYVFKSYEERESGIKSYMNNTSLFKDYLSEMSFSHYFGTKNILLIYTPKDNAHRYTRKIEDVLINQLNIGNILEFQEKGEYWAATYKYNFYSNYDEKELSSIQDNYCIEDATLTYIGEGPETIGDISFKLESRSHGYYGNDAFIPKDGKLYFRGGGVLAVDQLPDKKQIVTFSVEWKEQEEKFELKLKE